MRSKRKKYRKGDLVTIMKVPSDLRDDPELKTKTVFETCLGKTYAIQGFDRYGHLELAVGKDIDSLVGGYMNTIWIEPEFVMPAKKGTTNNRP
jgi:hypothetical protein